ncbi:MAG: hypothetical protein RL134_1444 [Actinomycetota bacterium]|jgi:hypothetical protein
MALDLRAIREAVAQRIQDRCKVTAYAHPTNSVVFPQATVLPGVPYVTYHITMHTRVEVRLQVVVRVIAADLASAQIARDELVNAGTGEVRSIFDALEEITSPATTPTLGGAVDNIHVVSVDAPQGVRDGDQFEFTATFDVVIQATRS